MWPYQFLPFGALQVTSGTILRLQLQALSFLRAATEQHQMCIAAAEPE